MKRLIFLAAAVFAFNSAILHAQTLLADNANRDRLHRSSEWLSETISFAPTPDGIFTVAFRADAGQRLLARLLPFREGSSLALFGPYTRLQPYKLGRRLVVVGPPEGQVTAPLHTVKLEGVGTAPFNYFHYDFHEDGTYVLRVGTQSNTQKASGLSSNETLEMTNEVRGSYHLSLKLDHDLTLEKYYAKGLPLGYRPDIDGLLGIWRIMRSDPPAPFPYFGLGTLVVLSDKRFSSAGRRTTFVYQSPSTAAKIVGEVSRKTAFPEKTAISYLPGWFGIAIDDGQDGIGWISGEDLTLVDAAKYDGVRQQVENPLPTHEDSIEVPLGNGPVRWSGTVLNEVRSLSMDLVEGTYLRVLRSEATSERTEPGDSTWTHLFDPDGELVQLIEEGATTRIRIEKTGAHKLELLAVGEPLRERETGEPLKTEVLLMAESD